MEKRKIKKAEKITLTVLFSLLFIGLGAAAWLLTLNGGVHIDVFSIGSQREVTLDFDSFSLNTTDTKDSGTAIMEFAYNKESNFSVSITETIGDLSGGVCTNNINDCRTNFTLMDGLPNKDPLLIKDGDIVSIPYNVNQKQVKIEMHCEPYSCPQTRDYTVSLEELPITS